MKVTGCYRFWVALAIVLFLPSLSLAAYHHKGEADSPKFLAVYPDKARTKLDSCFLCHSGGSYMDSKGKKVTLGSCQWCHYKYGYDAKGDIDQTLNQYGRDYRDFGRSEAALRNIERRDSDGDGYTNIDEIKVIRYPGEASDDPTKVPAPSRVFSKQELEEMPQHRQFMLMNTHKSGDSYVEYTGVTMEALLDRAGVISAATGIKVYSPDGFSAYHPLEYDPNRSLYHVRGIYPQAAYYYEAQADTAKTSFGWCDYGAPSTSGRKHGDPIINPNGLRMLLAIKRDGTYLTPGVLGRDNKLNGEGPFRVVPPQKVPSPPDQASTSSVQNVIWPYNANWDHNAGYSSRSVTIIKVEPLPSGTTDIDVLEAGWDYIDKDQVVVYGAIAERVSSEGCSLAKRDGVGAADLSLVIAAGVLIVVVRRFGKRR